MYSRCTLPIRLTYSGYTSQDPPLWRGISKANVQRLYIRSPANVQRLYRPQRDDVQRLYIRSPKTGSRSGIAVILSLSLSLC